MRSFISTFDWGEPAKVETAPVPKIELKMKKIKKAKSKRKDRVSGRR